MDVLVVPYINEQGRDYVTYQGEDYALEEIAAKIGKSVKTARTRFERYKEGEITIDQLFQVEIVNAIACPKRGYIFAASTRWRWGNCFSIFTRSLTAGESTTPKGSVMGAMTSSIWTMRPTKPSTKKRMLVVTEDRNTKGRKKLRH